MYDDYVSYHFNYLSHSNIGIAKPKQLFVAFLSLINYFPGNLNLSRRIITVSVFIPLLQAFYHFFCRVT